jgi:hypothetical protein
MFGESAQDRKNSRSFDDNDLMPESSRTATYGPLFIVQSSQKWNSLSNLTQPHNAVEKQSQVFGLDSVLDSRLSLGGDWPSGRQKMDAGRSTVRATTRRTNFHFFLFFGFCSDCLKFTPPWTCHESVIFMLPFSEPKHERYLNLN